MHFEFCNFKKNVFLWLCRILVAARGIFWLQHVGFSSLTRDEPRPPALEAWSLSHWTTREVPLLGILTKIMSRIFYFDKVKNKEFLIHYFS